MPECKPKSQIERFRDTARELGTDESEEHFRAVVRKVASAPPAPMEKKSKRRGVKSSS
jgi:hypothetical protein